MFKVSVIVPVYGVEMYIERCVRSLFSQTLDDIEYIFIDDCTPDKSIEILKRVLEEYPLRIEQTKIVRMSSNIGLAGVRRIGIQLATGDYIIHCDSDDWVAIDMYRIMYEIAINENSDVVICDYLTIDGNNETKLAGLYSTEKERAILDMLFQRNSWSHCNKLFKRTVYCNKITYPQGNMGEDMALVMQLMYYCDKISYVASPLYYYYQNPLSITKTMSPETVWIRFNHACNNARLLSCFYKATSLRRKINQGLVYIKFKQRNLLFPILNNKEYSKEWLRTFPEINLKICFCPHISIKEKIKFAFVFSRALFKTMSFSGR